jgi:hypothetical protein
VTARSDVVLPEHLPLEIQMYRNISRRPKRERRRTVSDDLLQRLLEERESFWTVVYPLFMRREITKADVRELVRKGLEEARGNYKMVARIFNMEPRDYKRFLNFLRKHDCQVPFKEYRQYDTTTQGPSRQDQDFRSQSHVVHSFRDLAGRR